MLNVDKNSITITDKFNQKLEFWADGNGDYYFTLFSNHEARSGDYYPFIIDESNPTYNYFKWFIEQEINYISDELTYVMCKTPYFIVAGNSVRIANQNKSIMESESMEFRLLEKEIRIIFTEKFPASIRVSGGERQDCYPFFTPVIELFNLLGNSDLQNVIKGTGCYQNIKSGNAVSITGDGGNAWGYFGHAYKKLAPSLKLYEYWRDNPDFLSRDDLIDYYIKEYFRHRLLDLDVMDLLKILKDRFGEELILLCHELPGIEISKETFCHRRVVADFIELKSGIIIPEISTDNQSEIITHEQRDYKPKLKKLIKEFK